MSSEGQGLQITVDGDVATLRLDRPERRNAISESVIRAIGAFFSDPPPEVRAAVLLGDGPHFCAGLDLSEQVGNTTIQGMEISRLWHRCLEPMELGKVPVVAALHGAVIGGGMELALAAHVRVADPSAYYALPEGRLGIYVGGGGSVRIARVIGADRMREMMLTGRRLSAEDGLRLGLAHELAEPGQVEERARELAAQVAGNAPITNQLILAALPRIDDMARSGGFWAESLTAALSQTTEDAAEGISAFFEKRPPDFRGV